MNALLASTNVTLEEHAMSSNEGASENSPLGEIRSDIRHLQSDVTELKAEVRATNQKVDALRVDIEGRVDARSDSLRTELSGRIEKLEAKFDLLKDSLASAKVWALVLYAGLAGAMLLTMARGFKWI